MAPGQATPSSSEKEGSSDGPVVDGGVMVNENSRSFCKACGNYGHQRRSSRLCTKNPKNIHYEGKTVGFFVIVTGMRNCRLCNRIERACRSVLTYRSLPTWRESYWDRSELGKYRCWRRTLRRFQFDAERENNESRQYGIGGRERRRFTFNRRWRISSLVLNEPSSKSFLVSGQIS